MSFSKSVVIANQRGLHARASAKFVQCASAFDAVVTVTKDGESVAGDSILDLMMLAAAQGSEVIISAEGAEAQAAVESLGTLVEGKFGEEE